MSARHRVTVDPECKEWNGSKTAMLGAFDRRQRSRLRSAEGSMMKPVKQVDRLSVTKVGGSVCVRATV